MQAVIMAGGFGSRLQPLTARMPKPMVPIIDRPILHCIVNRLKEGGVDEIAMTLGYMPERIKSYFGNGRNFGVSIRYFTETSPLGTAGGVKNAASFIKGPFVVISGDALTTIDIKDMYDKHIASGAAVTMAVKRVENPEGYGEVLLEDGVIVGFREKPSVYTSNIVNTGIYVMNKEVLDHIAEGRQDFSKDVFPKLTGKMRAYEGDFYWSDIGTLKSYYNANMDVVVSPEKFGFSFA